jgi:hypothetical protein
MTVKKLIKLLSTCPPDQEIYQVFHHWDNPDSSIGMTIIQRVADLVDVVDLVTRDHRCYLCLSGEYKDGGSEFKFVQNTHKR